MPKPLTIAGTVFDYPLPGENPGWGEAATDWASAVTDALGTLQGPGFIPTTTASISDNVTSFTDILGFVFSISSVRSFSAPYSVVRTNGTSSIVEEGVMKAVNDGTTWYFSIERSKDAGMTFNLTSGGQVQYKSTAVGGTYSGTIKFQAQTFSQ